jgi:DNA-binding transcriptional LysR family regulator
MALSDIDPIHLFSVELRTALTVAGTASFSQAARELGMQPSTVSRRVRELEDRVGVSLFERHRHGIRLTAAGQAFVDKATQSQAILSAALGEARHAGEAGSGHLRLGFVWSFAAGIAREIIASYRAQNPNIRLQLTELGAAEMARRTLARDIDYAWIVCWHDLDPALEVESLWSEGLYLAVASQDASIEGVQDLSVLVHKPYLCRSTDEWRYFQERLDEAGGPRMDIHAHDCAHDSLLSLVAAGDGVTLMPDSIAAPGHPGVHFIPIKDPRAHLEICAIWRRETDNPALRRFMALTRDSLRKKSPTPPAPPEPG